MQKIVRVGHELFLKSEVGHYTLISFNGTPVATSAKYEEVGEVKSLQEWQDNPGLYVRGGHYCLGHMVRPDGSSFVFGGSWLFAHAWADEHDCHIDHHTLLLFDDRNVVREMARSKGGVAW